MPGAHRHTHPSGRDWLISQRRERILLDEDNLAARTSRGGWGPNGGRRGGGAAAGRPGGAGRGRRGTAMAAATTRVPEAPAVTPRHGTAAAVGSRSARVWKGGR